MDISRFQKNVGMPVERWIDSLVELESVLEGSDQSALMRLNLPIDKLVGYYLHMQDLAKGYEKDPAILHSLNQR
jgi:hypothetical protein